MKMIIIIVVVEIIAFCAIGSLKFGIETIQTHNAQIEKALDF